MLYRNILAVILLIFSGNQNVFSKHWSVTHINGTNDKNCGNRTMPCRTVRYAVTLSNDGDQINVDYAQGRPYMECENVTKLSCSIELNKTISFHGVNGRPIIKCKKTCKLFVIKNSRSKITKIAFSNLVFSSTKTVAECSEANRFQLVLKNTTFENNSRGIYSQKSENCFININNSTFKEKSQESAIWLRCINLTVHIKNSVFKSNPIFLQTFYNKLYKNYSRILEVFVRDSVFDGEYSSGYANLFAIKPHALVLNVSIQDSAFVNHVGQTKKNEFPSSLSIRDLTKLDDGIYVSLRNIRVENNKNEWPAVTIVLKFNTNAPFLIEILDSTFRNNSGALSTQIFNHSKINHRVCASKTKIPTVIIHNNTFTENFNGQNLHNYVPAIFFRGGKYQVTSCHFYDNKAGSPFSAVVIVSGFSNVIFRDCHFENRQKDSSAAQLYVRGQSSVSLKGRNKFDIFALKNGETVFLRMPFHKNTGILLENNFKLVCPQGYALNASKRCTSHENSTYCTYMYITCFTCDPKTYTLKRAQFIYNTSENITCMQCPRGGNCVGGIVKAKPNFWGYKTNTSITFARCPPGYCCNSYDCVSYYSCHGNRTGTLCGRCSKGMSDSLFSPQCTPNTKCSGSLFIPSALVMLIAYLIFFLYHEKIVRIVRKSLFSSMKIFKARKRTGSKRKQGSGLLKVIFYFYQVVRLLQSTVGPQEKNQIIVKLEDIIGRILNIVLVDISSFTCPIQNLQPVQKAAILHSVGYCLLVLLGILYLVTNAVQMLKHQKPVNSEMRSLVTNVNKSCSSKFKARIASAFTYISLLMYASSTQLCLSLLHCVPVGDSEVLFLDGNIKCYQTFQYFLLAYVVLCVLPFCLVPVLGAYLLKMDRISVAQFCIACIFPLPFCCFWAYLLIEDYRFHKRIGNKTKESSKVVSDIHKDDEKVASYGACSADDRECCRGACQHNCCLAKTLQENSLRSLSCESTASEQHILKTAILRVLLGPFRLHKSFLCFGDLALPWEGFLIFRRLALIFVLTFVHDNRLKMMLTLTLCVAILTSHMYIKPFTRPLDNAIEALSLSTLTVLCGFTLIKNLYYGEDVSSLTDSLYLIQVFNKLENIVVVVPFVILIFIVILSVLRKLLLFFRSCLGS